MAGPAYVWDQWRFEPTECRLTRDGVIVPLPAKTLDLLATLLRRAPRLLTKEEILASVWKDAAVEEGNIAFHVAALRKALDEGDGPSAIETVRGRGYRFVHDIAIHHMPPTDAAQRVVIETVTPPSTPTATPEAIAAPTPARLRPRDRRTAMALVAASLVGGVIAFVWLRPESREWSLALQPFEIVNPAAGEERFPDGLSSYLASKMDLAGIKVAPSVDADAVLSGQLHPTPAGFRVEVQMKRSSDGVRVWDWSFDVSRDEDRPPAGSGPDDERSRVQAIIAQRVATGVRSYLSLSGTAPVTR
jgi:DNA-binding winged helix-turn-helix (wHTH) protein